MEDFLFKREIEDGSASAVRKSCQFHHGPISLPLVYFLSRGQTNWSLNFGLLYVTLITKVDKEGVWVWILGS